MSSESACVYAALILHDDGVEVTADKMATLIEAAGVEIESVWTTIFAKALEGKNLGDFLFNIGSGAAAPAAGAAAPAAGGAAAPAKEEKKKEEVKEESDDDMGFGLFD